MNQAAPNRIQSKGKKGARAATDGEAQSHALDHSFVLAVLAAVKAAQVHCLFCAHAMPSLLIFDNAMQLHGVYVELSHRMGSSNALH